MYIEKKYIFILVLIVVLLLGGWGWLRVLQIESNNQKMEELSEQIGLLQEIIMQEDGLEKIGSSGEESSDEMPLQVKVSRARSMPGEKSITYDGIIEPSNTVNIIPRVPGEVAEVLVEEGDGVQEGDVLLRMDTREIDKNIEQAEAGVEAARIQVEMAETGLRSEEIEQLEETIKQAETQVKLAERTYERIHRLYEEGIVPQQEYEQAVLERDMARSNLTSAEINLRMAKEGAWDLELEAARAQLRQAETQLELARMTRDDAVMTAPRDGVIIHREVEPGEMVGETMAPLVLACLDPVHLKIQVGGQDIGIIEKDQKAHLEIRALPEEEVFGQVNRVSLAADPESRLFLVEIEIENPQHKIRPGLYAEARIIIDPGPKAPLVPQEAVHYENDTPHVYTIRDNKVHPRPVSVGEEENGKAEITSGIKEGEKVIVYADGELAPGKVVEVVEGDWQ